MARTVASHRLGFRLYFPQRLTPSGRYASTVKDGTTTARRRASTRCATAPAVRTRPTGSSSWRTSRRAATTASRAPTGRRRRCWTTRPSTLTVHGRRLQLFKSGNRLRLRRLEAQECRLLGLELADPQPVQRADARHRRLPHPPRLLSATPTDERPPRLAWGMYKRFLLAAVDRRRCQRRRGRHRRAAGDQGRHDDLPRRRRGQAAAQGRRAGRRRRRRPADDPRCWAPTSATSTSRPRTRSARTRSSCCGWTRRRARPR